ncbi:hypothetical protein WJX81_003591 [Elliptochloris bilobata]|uniref:Uncharacterized protein n=1 Tax=Elliptochloris bilobata TaxID=381761 RepID=A0AAW1RKC4_9CHLO
MAGQTEALSRLEVTAEHGQDETGSPRDDYVLVDSGESVTPEPRTPAGAGADMTAWASPQELSLRPGSPQSSGAAAREQEDRAGLEALEDLCAAAPESPRSAPLRAALEGLRRENTRLRAALEEAGLQQEWVLGSVVKSSEAGKAQLVHGLREMTDQRDALLQELKHSETQFASMVAEALDERIRHLEAVLLGAPHAPHSRSGEAGDPGRVRQQAHPFFVRPTNAAAARVARTAAEPDQAHAAASHPPRAGLALARGLFRRASRGVGGLLGAAGSAVGQAGHVIGHAGQVSAGRLVHAAQVAMPLRRSALEGAAAIRERASAARGQLGAGAAAAGRFVGSGARRLRQRCGEARRRLVSASRMAAHAAGHQMGRLHAAAMRAFDSPAAQGYCKVAAAVAGAALVGAAVTEAAGALLSGLADARAERRAHAALAQQLAALVARAVAEPSSSLEFVPASKGDEAESEAAKTASEQLPMYF